MARPTLSPKRGPVLSVQTPHPRSAGRSYSRFVGLMKIVLPLVAVGLLGAVLLWPTLESRQEAALSWANTEIRADGLEMIAPVLTGVDDKGRPYTVTAAKATADGLQPTQVTLSEIKADMATEDGKPVHVIAAAGLYRLKAETLDLEGGVTVTLSDGHQVKLESVRLDLAKGTASSDKRVIAFGPTGQIEANSMSASDGGHVMHFVGQVRVVITPRDASPPAPPASGQPRNGE